MEENQTITITGDDGTSLSFYIYEQTKFLGNNYLLVAETPDDEEVFVLKEQETKTEEAVYSFVEDEKELGAVSALFEELLEDVDIKIED